MTSPVDDITQHLLMMSPVLSRNKLIQTHFWCVHRRPCCLLVSETFRNNYFPLHWCLSDVMFNLHVQPSQINIKIHVLIVFVLPDESQSSVFRSSAEEEQIIGELKQ